MNKISKFRLAIKGLMKDGGQDLVEYALVVALVAFAVTATMKTLATGISTAFTNISTALSTNIT